MNKRLEPTSPNGNGNGVASKLELKPDDLGPRLDPATLGFASTAELEPLDEVVGQDRARKALELGIKVRQRGYNVYVSGVSGTGKKQLVRELLERQARLEPLPDDWVYVHNFDDPSSPQALRLPAGHGARLRTACNDLIERFGHDLPEVLKTKDFDVERQRIATVYKQKSDSLFKELEEKAGQLQFAIGRQSGGPFVFFPLKDGKPMPPEEFEKLSQEERERIQACEPQLEEMAGQILAKQQDLSRSLRSEVLVVIRTFARRILDPLITKIQADYPVDGLIPWIDRVRDHLLDNLGHFQPDEQEPTDLPTAIRAAMGEKDPWLPCRVNVVVDNSHRPGIPVIVELSPNYQNLFGTIERDVNLFGHVTTDFTRIKPGNLLRANGGFLVLDLEDALTEPLVWKQLKRVLKSGQLLTEAYEPFALLAATTLKPQPIPITTKVVGIGSPELYYMLQFVDSEFAELFKIRADFGSETEGDSDGYRAYARFVAKLVRDEKHPPFNAAAVMEIIRQGIRETAHRGKLSVEFGKVADLVREAAYWASVDGVSVIGQEQVRQSLQERVYRCDRIAAKLRELIAEETLYVSVEGARVGQINGLSILDLGDYQFGRPNRVTASIGIGQDGVVNIERESDLSGSTHDKGVLILEGYLRNQYARRHPLTLSASLTFEQSYGWIEGDSASLAELFCLLSAIAEVPLRQNIAVTGSVNQHGEVQAVGGINEKIEGFFDVCQLNGLTSTQGVCIPRSNVRHLVLRDDVVDAVTNGRFHIWAIKTVDEGITLLTGQVAGDLHRLGTFHFRVDQRLQEFLHILQEQPAPVVLPRGRSGPLPSPHPALPPFPGEEAQVR
jgi:predicted ATP-dependent protease